MKNFNCLTAFLLLLLTAFVLSLFSCCRPATEFQMQKFERHYKFEAPRNTWGLHIHLFQKKYTAKY